MQTKNKENNVGYLDISWTGITLISLLQLALWYQFDCYLGIILTLKGLKGTPKFPYCQKVI